MTTSFIFRLVKFFFLALIISATPVQNTFTSEDSTNTAVNSLIERHTKIKTKLSDSLSLDLMTAAAGLMLLPPMCLATGVSLLLGYDTKILKSITASTVLRVASSGFWLVRNRNQGFKERKKLKEDLVKQYYQSIDNDNISSLKRLGIAISSYQISDGLLHHMIIRAASKDHKETTNYLVNYLSKKKGSLLYRKPKRDILNELLIKSPHTTQEETQALKILIESNYYPIVDEMPNEMKSRLEKINSTDYIETARLFILHQGNQKKVFIDLLLNNKSSMAKILLEESNKPEYLLEIDSSQVKAEINLLKCNFAAQRKIAIEEARKTEIHDNNNDIKFLILDFLLSDLDHKKVNLEARKTKLESQTKKRLINTPHVQSLTFWPQVPELGLE